MSYAPQRSTASGIQGVWNAAMYQELSQQCARQGGVMCSPGLPHAEGMQHQQPVNSRTRLPASHPPSRQAHPSRCPAHRLAWSRSRLGRKREGWGADSTTSLSSSSGWACATCQATSPPLRTHAGGWSLLASAGGMGVAPRVQGYSSLARSASRLPTSRGRPAPPGPSSAGRPPGSPRPRPPRGGPCGSSPRPGPSGEGFAGPYNHGATLCPGPAACTQVRICQASAEGKGAAGVRGVGWASKWTPCTHTGAPKHQPASHATLSHARTCGLSLPP